MFSDHNRVQEVQCRSLYQFMGILAMCYVSCCQMCIGLKNGSDLLFH